MARFILVLRGRVGKGLGADILFFILLGKVRPHVSKNTVAFDIILWVVVDDLK